MTGNGTPRLLLGAALLFWGGMTGRPLPGLLCALLLEAAHWTRVRWNFTERAHLYAWRISVLLLLVAMVLVLLQGARLNAMARVFSWLPVVLLPLQFVQSYGMTRTMSLAVFSLMVRRRREHAEKHRLPFRELRFSFASVFICATLLAAALGEQTEHLMFFPGLVILTAWALAAFRGADWRKFALAGTLSITLASVIGLGGQVALTRLYQYLIHRGESPADYGLDYRREHQTSIGRLGRIKQSPQIYWRLLPEQGPLPSLLRIASYSSYQPIGARWNADLLPQENDELSSDLVPTEPLNEGFQPLTQILNPYNPTDLEDSFFIAPPDLPDQRQAVDQSLARFRLRGAMSQTGSLQLLPVPGNTASFHEFTPEEFGRNPYGTFRYIPDQPVIDARILWDPRFSPELPPWYSIATRKQYGSADEAPARVRIQPDLEIPRQEAEALARVADAIGLRQGDLQDKITTLRLHFMEHFAYTRYNRVLEDHNRRSNGTLIGNFLEHTRAGHCEFYATATALLLREVGVPTRYVSGFAVVEREKAGGPAIIRGIHGHAWCRAWDAQAARWIDVDLTPPDWLGLESAGKITRYQAMVDWFQQRREDLLVWRDKPGHMKWLTLAMLTPLVAGFIFIGRRLWKSRARMEADASRRRGAAPAVTPLTALERSARHHLGQRPPGTPLATWLLGLQPLLPRPELLRQALDLHHRLRFDPSPSDPQITDQLRAAVEEIRAAMSARRKV